MSDIIDLTDKPDYVKAAEYWKERFHEADAERIALREIAEKSGAWKTADGVWVSGQDIVFHRCMNGDILRMKACHIEPHIRRFYSSKPLGDPAKPDTSKPPTPSTHATAGEKVGGELSTVIVAALCIAALAFSGCATKRAWAFENHTGKPAKLTIGGKVVYEDMP